MSNSAEAPAGGNSPPPPVGSSADDGGGGSSSSTPAPPPASSSSAPPPSSQSSPPSPPPPTQSPPSSNSSSAPPPSNSGSLPLSPPPPASNSPPSDSQPPKSSPPSNSNSSPPPPRNSSSSPPPPSSQSPPDNSSPPPASVQPAPPPSKTPPSEGSTAPSQSLPSPTPSNNTNSPVPGGSVPSPPPQSTTPPLPVSPPVAGDSPPNTPANPTPSTKSPPTSSSASPPPPPKSSNHVPSSSSSTNSSSASSSGNSGTNYMVGVITGVIIIFMIAFVWVASNRRKRRAKFFANQYRPASNFSVKSDGNYYGQQYTTGGSGQTDAFYTSQPQHGTGNGYGSQRGGNMHHQGAPDSNTIGGAKSWFSYEELMEVTNGFSQQNILGQGGFGCVYKGLLPDGRVVAVKELKAGGEQGEREFRAEVEIISRVHHRYLVSLVGYCIAEHHRLLIYEFVPNKTLEHHLHGKGLPVLDWAKRVKIALGAARGLAYLHEDCHPKIIHRDIKSANILLDDAFEAQVADFGLAKLTNDTSTHVSTRVMGTFGYMAPEYASSGKLTDRSDVYSFGVVLLELVTGRKAVDESQPMGDESLVEWARPLLNRALETGNFGDFVDQRLGKNYVESEMFRMIEAAAACVRHSAPKRPRMVQVVRALDSEGEMSDLSNGVKFGQSTIYESSQYNQDIMRFRRMAFGSEDSGNYDMNSGEYTSREHGSPSSGSLRIVQVSSPVVSQKLEP
ncbi:hypothetical protein L1049_006716 [Liquidambar formosana]|uniref:non-specific serine/threonine protein kinase n=1 Tax=Liquidambar formosana TaxID=63359 RepID=A0AAP0WRC6_LIQFO